MVVTPLNIKELQAADKNCAKVLHNVDSSVRQVLHNKAQLVERFGVIDGVLYREFL